jgi:hypothetical protein
MGSERDDRSSTGLRTVADGLTGVAIGSVAMASTIAWLDFSEEDQRRAREIVALFSQQESRDELGVGTIRDALSDAMFPGVSVIQTRARYFLFVPWLFREGERRGYTGRELVGWVDGYERRLIEALRRGGEGGIGSGLIGRVAGVRIKTLPSTIYWNGLQRFGILRRRGTIDQVAEGAGRPVGSVEEALTELVDRAEGIWDANLPAEPTGFFQMDRATFGLDVAEADWLAERIVASVPGTLLEWLVTNRVPVSGQAAAPWEEPAVADAPAALRRVVEHAERFSTVMHGAALLYNRLLAERCVELGIEIGVELVETYTKRLGEWHQVEERTGGLLGSWDLDAFWAQVRSVNPRVPPLSKAFVDRWVGLVRRGQAGVGDAAARQLVAARERQQKGSQARLVNDRLLWQWGGRSGTARLTFRWDRVTQLLGDIQRGRERDARA